MCSLKVIAGLVLGGPVGAAAGASWDQATQSQALTNKNGDQLSDADAVILNQEQDPAKKSQMLMNWLVGPKPKTVNPGEEFAQSERMSGIVAKADAGKGMGGLFGMGLLVGDTAPNLNLPVGQPGQEPSAAPIVDLTPEGPALGGGATNPATPTSPGPGYTGGPLNGPGGGNTQSPTTPPITGLSMIRGMR